MLIRFAKKTVDREWINSNFSCMMACPAHTNAGRYATLIAKGRFGGAYRFARDPNRRVCGATWYLGVVKPHPFTEGDTLSKMSAADLVAIISHGGPALNKSPLMPTWGYTLSKSDIVALISYIRAVVDPPY
jgi:hypothetical protein